MLSNYRSHIWLKLSKMLRSQRERWMSNAHRSLGSLGNRAHRSSKRSHEIRAAMWSVISSISLGFVQAPCAVREYSGAGQGHLPGCPGLCRSIPLPSRGWVALPAWGLVCVKQSSIISMLCCHGQGECPWPWCSAGLCFLSDLTRYRNSSASFCGFFLKPFLPSPSSL